MKLLLTLFAGVTLCAASASGQEIPRDTYLTQTPLGLPRLTPQTRASAALHLWGDHTDPSYRDVAPKDGIDDRRHAVLEALAVRFAPFLVQNSAHFPMNFDTFIRNRASFPLSVDTWDISGERQVRIGTREVNFSALGQSACPPGGFDAPFARNPMATFDQALEDCKLLALLAEFSPASGVTDARDTSLVRSLPALTNVLFFNFPGEGARSWKDVYRDEYNRTPDDKRAAVPHAYVHPFLADVTGESGQLQGYELVLQYWFFYPNNDSGMDHEGDWEHMNVVVSPRSMVERALPAGAVQDILHGVFAAGDHAADPLVIKRADYYFHELVWSLDFSSPNVYLPRDEWWRVVQSRPEERFQERRVWEQIRHMAYVDDAETTVNTHPFGYIGGDSKGINQALVRPGSSNRDPHGTFPLPGRYSNVGPGGSTDHITSYVDSRKYLQALRSGTASVGPDFRQESVLGLADPDRLLIVPDWERIVPLAHGDAQVRRDWSWLILPIRWGYPATRSPFAGVLKNFNTGNVAPPGPSYNGGWNVTGPGSGFGHYSPHTVPSIFPLQFQDNFRNDLGVLNLTAPALLNLPPFNFLARFVAYPFRVATGRRDPVYYPADKVPFRFFGISSGVSYQVLSQDFDALTLSAPQFEPFVVDVLTHFVSNGSNKDTQVLSARPHKSASVGPFFQVPFFVGGRFVSENTVRNTRATFGTDFEFNNIPSYSYQSDLNYWEFAGSLRYNFSSSRLQPFAKGGYGWSWYRLENIRGNGKPFDQSASPWRGPGSLLPNVWHYGVGVEFVPWKRIGTLPGGLDLGLRAEYTRYTQRLSLDFASIPLDELRLLFNTINELPGRNRVVRTDFLFGLTFSW